MYVTISVVPNPFDGQAAAPPTVVQSESDQVIAGPGPEDDNPLTVAPPDDGVDVAPGDPGGTGEDAPAGDTTGSTAPTQPAGTSAGGVDIGEGTGTGSGGVTGAGSGGGTRSGGGSGVGGGAAGDECAANNGGATDTGVTAREIQVAATVVRDGPGASLLEPAGVGMQAVLDKVNRQGGICGRRIVLQTANDSWDAARGRDYIRRFIDDGAFALLVVPSSEGLAEAISAGDISRSGIPVVGSTGLRIDEYRDPWVFPVSTATVSIMRIMAHHAHQDGARQFGIVWDNKYRFGREGADGFKKYVSTLPGASIRADQQLDPDKGTYGTEATSFNNACGLSGGQSGCDAVMLLLVPQTALQWRSANPGSGAGRGKTTYGAQTLFTNAFASACRDWCDGMRVWTGYNPPITPLDARAGIREYDRDVKATRPGVDSQNQFVQGAYLGALVFVEAIERCSPNVTRVCVRDTLNQITYESDLSSPLSWRPNQRHANTGAQSFTIEASSNSFNGWRHDRTGFIRDPNLGG